MRKVENTQGEGRGFWNPEGSGRVLLGRATNMAALDGPLGNRLFHRTFRIGLCLYQYRKDLPSKLLVEAREVLA